MKPRNYTAHRRSGPPKGKQTALGRARAELAELFGGDYIMDVVFGAADSGRPGRRFYIFRLERDDHGYSKKHVVTTGATTRAAITALIAAKLDGRA